MKALKSISSVETTTSERISNTLELALAPGLPDNVLSLEKFDANKHSAKKYRVTLPNGGIETGDELYSIIEECFDSSDVLAWANDAFDSNVTDSVLISYAKSHAWDFLTDNKCKVEEYFE